MRYPLWFAVLLAFVIAAPLRAGGKVAIVRSSGFSLYEKVVQSFKQASKTEIVADVVITDDGDRNEALLQDVRSKKPAVILTLGTSATRLVREKVPSIPSVFAVVLDPTASRLSPPGVPVDVDPVAQVDFIRRNFSRIKRVGVLYSPGLNVEAVAALERLRAGGESIVLVEVPALNKLNESIGTLADGADCLLMLSDPVIYSPQTAPQLILQLIQRRVPIFTCFPAYVKAGALAGLQADPVDNGRVAASIVDRILKGEKPSSIAYAWPSKYVISLNMIVADRMSIPVPASVINSAEQVVK